MNIQTIEIEKEDLATHVELCAQRYKELYERTAGVEDKLDKMADAIKEHTRSTRTTMISVLGTIIVALIGATGIILAAIINHPIK